MGMTTLVSSPALQLVLDGEMPGIDLEDLQGLWTVDQYFRLSDRTNRLLEFVNGRIEVLPMPTRKHQRIAQLLNMLLLALMEARGGIVLFAPFKLYVQPDKYREPDLLLLLDENDPRNQATAWSGADLVVEVVSPDNATLDTHVKRVEYAEAGIPEYWIVNPLDETITVLTLAGSEYTEHGVFRRGDMAISRLLPEFTVAADRLFNLK
jgi:Uma2 family endonuclease